MFYDVVEIFPTLVVVEISRCFGADAPNLVELSENFESRVGFNVGNCLEFAIAGLVFVEEVGNFLIAAREGQNFSGALDGIGVCRQ